MPKGVDFKLNKSFSNNDCISTDKVDLDKKQIKKFLKQINISQLTKMIQFIDNKLLSDWDFNCLTYFDESEYPFFDINLSLICTIDHNIPINIIINFLCFVEKQYNNVPYHNTIHATMVIRMNRHICIHIYIYVCVFLFMYIYSYFFWTSYLTAKTILTHHIAYTLFPYR